MLTDISHHFEINPKIAAIIATASALCVGCNKDENPAQIHYVMGTSVTNPSNFKSALISQWGHSEVITQCFSNHGF